MKSSFLLAILALNAWTAFALPVGHNADQPEDRRHLSLKYISSPVGRLDNPPHFSDLLREEQERLRTSVLEAGGKGPTLPSTWLERTQKTIKSWWAFYLTQYPSKPEDTQRRRKSSPFSAVKMSKDENTTDAESEETNHNDATQFGGFMHNLSRMDPSVICSKFSPEIIGLCIFLLVPAAVMVVEAVDMLHNRWVPEQYPERGRGRVRLTGPERHFTILANYEREKAAQDQARKWWATRRRSK